VGQLNIAVVATEFLWGGCAISSGDVSNSLIASDGPM